MNEHVLMAMHEDAIHKFNTTNTSQQLFWNGRASAITDILALLRADEVRKDYNAIVGGGDEAAA